MENINLLGGHQWRPFEQFGFTNSFFALEADPLIYTWFILLLLIVLLVPVSFIIRKKNSLLSFAIISVVRTFNEFCSQTIGYFSYNHTCFIASLFIFIALCNSISLIPTFEEPTSNINTTLALGIVSFLYIQCYTIKAQGIIAYIKEYFSPIFLMAPLNVIGKIANIISMSFRLFGNIFGGYIIASIYLNAIQGSFVRETLGLPLGFVITFYSLFEGLLQAFVFASLTLTYLSLAIAQDEFDEPKSTSQPKSQEVSS